MRVSVFSCGILLFALQMFAASTSKSQSISETHVSFEVKNESLKNALKKLEDLTGYILFYPSEKIDAYKTISIKNDNRTVADVLTILLANTSLNFKQESNRIILFEKPVAKISVQAPSILLSGKVLDDNGEPLPGVTIKFKGTSYAWTTNLKGEFTMLLQINDGILQFSYIGYITQELSIKSLKSPVVIKLRADIGNLDQVQILAYTTTTKRLNTGSSFTIKADELAKNPVPSVLQALENRVPGLAITQKTGQIGGAFTVRVRGINGLNTIDPLYIVDGVPFPAGGNNNNPNGQPGGLPQLAGNRNTGVSGQQGGNALNYINPEDIESIDVLKDADATAIYGSRGAYGVILITTKKGKPGKPQLSLNLNRGTAIPGSYPDLLNTDDYLMLRREALKNDGLSVTAADVDLNGTYPTDRYTNWAKLLTGHNAATTRLNAGYSGGNDQTTFSVSGNYNDQGNVLQAKGYDRNGSLRVQLSNTTPNKKLSVDVTGLYTSTVNTMVPYDFTGDASILRAPNAPSYYAADGSLDWSTGTNPYSYLNVIYKGVINNLIGSTSFNYRPVKGLAIRANMGYNLLSGNEFRGLPSTVFNPALSTINQSSTSTVNNYSIRTISFEPYVSYSTPISKGTLTVTAGGTLQDKLNTQTVITGTGFVADARINNPSAGTTTSQSYNQFQFKYLGYFGSVNFNWANKYLLNSSVRYDGSTRFGEGHRYGTFGSVGAAYIFTEEKWIKQNLPFLSFGKIRGSYGTSGGDGIPNYVYLSTYTTSNAYLGNSTFVNNGLSNSDLHWELTKKLDYGVTLGFLNDRITIDGGYYQNKTSDELVQQPLSTTTGFSSVAQNSPALLESTGFEFSLSTTNISKKTFKWSTNAVLTIPRTKLLAFPEGTVLTSSNYIVGGSLTNVKLYNYVGVDPQTGLYNFINAAGVQGPYTTGLATADKTQNLDVSQRYFGSVSNTITYKALTLDFTFSFVNSVSPTFQGLLSYLPGTLNQNETSWALGRWQKPGDVTNVPKATTGLLNSLFGQLNFKGSTGAYERIFFSRLQNASLSYSLNNSFFKKLSINNARVFINGQNLLTFSKYKDLDPENPSLTAMPPLRVINLGLNLTL